MYFVQQLVIATWTQMSVHTLYSDAAYQMNLIYGSNVLQLNAMHLIDGLGNVYATKSFGSSLVQILPIPVQPAISALLYVIFP